MGAAGRGSLARVSGGQWRGSAAVAEGLPVLGVTSPDPMAWRSSDLRWPWAAGDALGRPRRCHLQASLRAAMTAVRHGLDVLFRGETSDPLDRTMAVL